MSKLPVFQWFNSRGDVLITVNTHSDGVNIPQHLRHQELVDFVLGDGPTPKLQLNEYGATAPMRFSGSMFTCYFPWSAVVQMSGQDAVIQFRNPSSQGQEAPVPLSNESAGKRRANLRLVK